MPCNGPKGKINMPLERERKKQRKLAQVLMENPSIKSTPTQTDKREFSTPVKNRQRFASVSKVRVVVRLRPFLPHEISSRNEKPIFRVSLQEPLSSSDEVTVLLKDQGTSRNECYKLDAFFDQGENNVSQIFDKEVRPLIPGLFHGSNATVFAYGATGSGKTYTMQGSDVLPGLMPLALSVILSICKCTGSNTSISYYEIYLDKCYDLLEPKDKEIFVWNDKDGKTHLKGLAQVEVDSTDRFHEIFNSALQRRKVAHTKLNNGSSRSHGVLVVTVSSNDITGKLNFIDLAGNEDNRRACNEGIRLQESAKINQSLLALSNVIHALNNCQPRIPYRESKLTRILQDSLGGTSHALMVTCLNPGEYQECVHTVSLAARSRHVSNYVESTPKGSNSSVKVDMDAKLTTWLESKGKLISAQRTRACTPLNGKSSTQFSAKSSKQRSAGRYLFNGDTHVNPIPNSDAALNNEENCNSVATSDDSLFPTNPETTAKQLSPIDSNIVGSTFEPKTPKSSSITTCTGDNSTLLPHADTPLDKFTSRSCKLKNSLIQDYLEFLNTASREELMEIKGIGRKIADYIIQSRETSPLNSLDDVEKIGLSSKQVHNMFGKAARGVLETFDISAPP